MPEPDGVDEELAAFPPALRALVDAERAVGNPVADLGHSHPAPPRGAFVRLERPLTTAVPAGLVVRERNGSLSSDEVTDDEAVHWVVGGPHPPPEPIDMDAIRAAANRATAVPPTPAPAMGADVPSGAWARFVDSVPLDYERWHDGIGMDLEAIDDLAPDERARAEALLRAEPPTWREVEALARLATPGAEAALGEALRSGPLDVRLAVAEDAPHLVGPGELDALLVWGLATVEPLDGLSRLLSHVARHHPPSVVEALWACARTREGDVAVHAAAMLDFVAGPARSTFDWDHRPLYLRFHAPPGTPERAAALADLAARTVGG